MSIAYTHYAQVKDNYCLAYLGLVPEYIVQLRMLRPMFKAAFPELTLFISCRDEFMFMLDGEDDVVPQSEVLENKNRFGYIREIPTNLERPHSLHQIVQESLTNHRITPARKQQNARRCLVCPDAAHPTRPLKDLARVKAYVEGQGYRVRVAGSDFHPGSCPVDVRPVGKDKLEMIAKADWVIGVENEFLFEAVRLGVRTTLIPTGLGTELYKFLCSTAELFDA